MVIRPLLGTQIDTEKDLSYWLDIFRAPEGFNSVYYGPVRNGKTRTATADIMELLRRGEIVYANWMIDFKEYDERTNFWIVLVKFFSRNNYFYKFDARNFHYFHPDKIDIPFLGNLVGVHLFIDEGQWIFNSHIRDGASDPLTIAKRKLILHGGHYCRSLNVITQRPSNILKDVRSQINIWYRCAKRFDAFGLMVFQRWEIEEMKDDLPVDFEKDEDGRQRPVGKVKTYFVNKKHDPVFAAYNTHAMRSSDAIEELPKLDAYYLSTGDKVKLILSKLPFLGTLGRAKVSMGDKMPVEHKKSMVDVVPAFKRDKKRDP